LYWDDFELRAKETVDCLAAGKNPPVRRVAVFITEGCNFRCDYCNVKQTPTTLSKKRFEDALAKYGDTAIIHITGGEPSIVPWLYPLIKSCSEKYRFHLNTNAFIMPPAAHVKRLKVSLDSDNEVYWDNLVGRTAWRRVCQNIQRASEQTVTSITYTLPAENYRDAPRFIQFANVVFPHLYALFFSVYKGTHPRFVFQPKHIDDFFESIVPKMESAMDKESLALFKETIGNKLRLIAGVRFPDNDLSQPCYLSMSERVISPSGEEFACSHLYRDGIKGIGVRKCGNCLYGCNQRLVDFNNLVASKL
jgi:MoaA/NifB/PqqE/SkfB family radical SAM enzyme